MSYKSDLAKCGAVLLASLAIAGASGKYIYEDRVDDSKYVEMRDSAVEEFVSSDEYMDIVSNELDPIYENLKSGKVSMVQFEKVYSKLCGPENFKTMPELINMSSNEEIIAKYNEASDYLVEDVRKNGLFEVLAFIGAVGGSVGALVGATGLCGTALEPVVTNILDKVVNNSKTSQKTTGCGNCRDLDSEEENNEETHDNMKKYIKSYDESIGEELYPYSPDSVTEKRRIQEHIIEENNNDESSMGQ